MRSFFLSAFVLTLLASAPVAGAAPGLACERLVGVALPEASVASAERHAAGAFEAPAGGALDVGAAFCRVSVVARPTAGSEIGIEVWLPEPSAWNGRLWGWGNSGYGGAIDHVRLGGAVGQGYATVATDGGHRGRGTRWALGHPDRVADLGHRAVHLAAVHAKAVAAVYYGEAPRFAYFSGFSTGGTQGLRLAQDHPGAYDGIVAGGADQDWTGLYLWLAGLQFAEQADPERHLTSAQIGALAGAARAACGDADGVVEAPDRCAVEAVLRAYEPTRAAPALTWPQVDYVRALYAGPLDPDGRPLPVGYAPGSEAGWDGVHAGPAPGEGSWVARYLTSFFRDLAFQDTTWTPDGFRFARDAARTNAALADALNATDPDLRAFAARGGKLILWHGWSDPLVPAGFTLRYAERVRDRLGPDATDEAVRLFMVPGVGHESAGPLRFGPLDTGGGDPARSLGAALQAWVEAGTAPERVVATRPATDGAPEASRQVRAWPLGQERASPTPPPVALAGTQEVDLVSEVNGQTYRLYVALPDGYAAGDTTRYPVLYLLDGRLTLPAAVTARAFQDIYSGLDRVVLVGIGNGEETFDGWFTNRWRDYTPSAQPATDSLVAAQFGQNPAGVVSGGGPAFLRVFREEVIPLVDAAYRTTSDRGLAGQSLGGLFAAYALFEAPGLFQRVGIHSPSLWWGEGELLAAEAAFAEAHTALPAHVLVTVGGEEGRSMVPPAERFAEALRSRGYDGLTVEAVVFADETHTSVVPAQVSRTLRSLYARPD